MDIYELADELIKLAEEQGVDPTSLLPDLERAVNMAREVDDAIESGEY